MDRQQPLKRCRKILLKLFKSLCQLRMLASCRQSLNSSIWVILWESFSILLWCAQKCNLDSCIFRITQCFCTFLFCTLDAFYVAQPDNHYCSPRCNSHHNRRMCHLLQLDWVSGYFCRLGSHSVSNATDQMDEFVFYLRLILLSREQKYIQHTYIYRALPTTYIILFCSSMV